LKPVPANGIDRIELIKAFGAFFAIMNPFVSLPVFLSLTNGFSVVEQRTLAIRVAIFSTLMCAAILFAGRNVLGIFGITIDEFRIAGGLVLAQISWSMLSGIDYASHHGSAEEKEQMQDLESLAFYPIAFPVIVGPGTIATLIIYANHSNTLAGVAAVGGVVGAVLLITFLVLFFAASFGKVLSGTLRTITTRLMGMILLAIAVDMILSGAKAVLPGLS